jgi:hypothetical protein
VERDRPRDRIEVWPPKGAPGSVARELRAVAQAHPGDVHLMLCVTVSRRGAVARRRRPGVLEAGVIGRAWRVVTFPFALARELVELGQVVVALHREGFIGQQQDDDDDPWV